MTEQQQIPIKVGYTVGITDEGKLVFNVIGTDKPMITDLFGLQKYAELQVDSIYSKTFMTGDALIHEVGLAVGGLYKKMKEVSPPDEED